MKDSEWMQEQIQKLIEGTKEAEAEETVYQLKRIADALERIAKHGVSIKK